MRSRPPALVTAVRPGPADPKPQTAAVLTRLARRLPLRADDDLLALVLRSRRYVCAAVPVAAVPGAAGYPAVRLSLHRATGELLAVAAPGRTARARSPGREGVPVPLRGYGLLLVRCRRSRTVWLPPDTVWDAALADEAGWRGLSRDQLVLVTEHGWRSRHPDDAGYQPSLRSARGGPVGGRAARTPLRHPGAMDERAAGAADPATSRVRVVVRGRVQGVFYRGSCRVEASRLGVRGWVRNRSDGAVEAVFEGAPPAVAALVAWSGHGPPYADVEDVEVRDEPAEGLTGFDVR